MDHSQIFSKIHRLEAIQKACYTLSFFFGIAFFVLLVGTGSVYSMILLGIMFVLFMAGFGIGQKIIALCQEGVRLSRKELADLIKRI